MMILPFLKANICQSSQELLRLLYSSTGHTAVRYPSGQLLKTNFNTIYALVFLSDVPSTTSYVLLLSIMYDTRHAHVIVLSNYVARHFSIIIIKYHLQCIAAQNVSIFHTSSQGTRICLHNAQGHVCLFIYALLVTLSTAQIIKRREV
jgi:hypothetical protein